MLDLIISLAMDVVGGIAHFFGRKVFGKLRRKKAGDAGAPASGGGGGPAD